MARQSDISGRQVPTAYGEQWLVPLAAVQERARHSGRGGAPSSPASTLPEGHLPVPVEAWQAALAQLAHLHQAGQERAARAETTATFLRKRQQELCQEIAELRQRLDERAKAPSGRPQRRRWWQW